MKTLKTRYVRKSLEKKLISERLLFEAINDDLLNGFKVAMQKGDELAELLSSVELTTFAKIVKQLNAIVRNEFRKSTDFFGNDKLIRARVKTWLQKFWKNSTLQRFDKFVDDLDESVKRVVKAVVAFIPKNQLNSIDQINDLFINDEDSGNLRRQQLMKIIKNSFQLKDPDERKPAAFVEASEKMLRFSVDQLKTFSEILSTIRNGVSSSVEQIDQPQTSDVEKTTSKNIQQPQNIENHPQQKLDVNTIVDTLSSLSKDDFSKLMRYISAKRKLSDIKI